MNFLSQVESKRILVIGDVMVDIYYYGDVNRISPEAPVPVFKKMSERSVLGGAANVAANLVAAGQQVYVMSIIGNDDSGQLIKDLFQSQSINTHFIIETERDTTVKTRFMTGNNQQVLRMDVEDTFDINESECNKLLALLALNIQQFDLIIISDYLKGLLTYDFTQGILQLAKQKSVPTIVDVKDTHFEKYSNALMIKPNLKELKDLTGMQVSNDLEIIEASEKLRIDCKCKFILTTCGARGMVLVSEEEPYFIESVNQDVFDVTGAGDTTIAYMGACIANGFTIKDSVDISNYAAGIQVSKVGTSSVYWHEIKRFLSKQSPGLTNKILTSDAIGKFRENNTNKKIVFTNGCFDILHIGHVRYLREASEFGDIMVVGLNSDASVKRLKGVGRPINAEMERAELLCALGFIDYVVIFDEDTPYELIKMIQPDVLIKGGDYSSDEVVGRDFVEARGGQLILIPYVEGKSTTDIIHKIMS